MIPGRVLKHKLQARALPASRRAMKLKLPADRAMSLPEWPDLHVHP